MKFTVPFEFRSMVRMGRQQNFRSTTLSANTIAEVVELKAEEAPMVARLPATNVPGYRTGPAADIHNWGGIFLRPFWNYRIDDHQVGLTTLSELVAFASRPALNSSAIPHDDPSIRGEENSTRDEVEAALLERFNRLFSIEGVVYEIMPEPLYRANCKASKIIEIVTDAHESIRTNHIWRLDRFDSMVAELLRSGDIRDEDVPRLEELRVHIFRPDLLRFDDELFAIANQARYFLDSFDTSRDNPRSIVVAGGPDTLHSYAVVRDELTAILDADRGGDVLVAELANLCDLTERDNLHNWRLQETCRAIERWELAKTTDFGDDAVLSER